MDEDSNFMFFRRPLISSLVKQCYHLKTNKTIVNHWSFNDPSKTDFYANIILDSLESSLLDNTQSKLTEMSKLIKSNITKVNDNLLESR